MEDKYYKLSQYRTQRIIGGWENIYFLVNEKGELTILESPDRYSINSKLEEISKDEKDKILREARDG